MILLPPISGLLFPIPTLVCVYLGFLCRILFVVGYNNWKLTALRGVGHGVFQICVTVLIVTAAMTGIKVMQVGNDKYVIEHELLVDKIMKLKEKYE